MGIGIKTTDCGSYLELWVDMEDSLEVQVDGEVYVASKDSVDLAGSQLALGRNSGSRTKVIGDT